MSTQTALIVVPPGFVLKEFTSFPSSHRLVVAEKVAKIERKVFPSSENFDYDIELKKKNIGLLLAFKEGEPDNLVAYLVYQRLKRQVWLHKLCVVEVRKGKGLGKFLIHSLNLKMKKGGCQNIQLWLDENRKPARALYASCGFQQLEYRPDYYSPGRPGLRMGLFIG
ncbi:uncharacterized protein K460DRAFT_272191 [Cucurbitaria berberidis CBS 394.84]|uniref:N-acetyltransferase domain-containing protein n=1 Tax=Cucurbitaria berberidis CBS 394.84 TaxID=1168544 RepID=A0A9P4GR49_9PLEO|nr:uncharacterized protein K460DRAFT_272191 [Cucurbitaria berberidis CBS 394.84]KAF1849989.1 hypothetical protein K460DRAFT_272191 [Cucurbitaria berberidis CBS 394.84]